MEQNCEMNFTLKWLFFNPLWLQRKQVNNNSQPSSQHPGRISGEIIFVFPGKTAATSIIRVIGNHYAVGDGLLKPQNEE